MLGEPGFTKFDEKEDGSVELEITISCRPQFDLGDYKALVPEMTAPTVSEEEIEEQLKDMASQGAELQKNQKKKNG
jgi:trigger factor